MLHMKRGDLADQRPLLTCDQNDDALLNIEPAMHPIMTTPYSASIPMQPTNTAVNMQSGPSAVYVTTQPAACGGGSVYMLSQPVKPNPHCCLSIISFLLCPVFGLIAWVFACCTNCENDRDNLQGAKCRSSCACGWAVMGIVLSLLSAVVVVVMVIGGFGMFAHAQQQQQQAIVNDVVTDLSNAVQDGMHKVGDVANDAAASVDRMVNGNSIGNNLNREVDKIGHVINGN